MYSPPLSSTNRSDSKERINTTSSSQLRLYQIWQGRNRFYLGGRLVFGPDIRALFLTLFLILVPVALFCAFVSRGLVNAFPHQFGYIIVAISLVFSVIIVVLLLLTSGTDPGIVPRNAHPPDADDECETSSISTSCLGSQTGPVSLPPMKNVTVNGIVVKVKYCKTCMLYRPPRCSHCSICDNCIERFDHHCPWVGQCIGKRNYRYFFMFVSSTNLLSLYVFAFCWINLKKIMEAQHCNIWSAFLKSPASGVLIMYTFVVSWFLGGLTAFHLYLIITNQTTYENYRYRYERKMNPFNLGCARNFKEIFFTSMPSSRVNFRAHVKVDRSSSFNTSSYLGGATTNSDMHKMKNFDVEVGRRQAVDADECKDIDNRIRSVGGGVDRCER
ncbi:probable protein S-acyltransferase 7 [Lycium barbarum]|uniref:probable protein S-acyltransferase 7 n=1 Tax=Lycium barbarum TaxID=112863 RepID=UPI00293ED205|nr:probable protein S-acyltransferase 7 [Lycium barbarum]